MQKYKNNMRFPNMFDNFYTFSIPNDALAITLPTNFAKPLID